jgi:small-conductance mechanosensitive channel
MAAKADRSNRVFLLLFATAIVGLALYFYARYFEFTLPQGPHANWLKLPLLGLAALLGYLASQLLNAVIFDFAFRFRKGYEAPTLVRNIFTLLAFAIFFVLSFRYVYSQYDLGALFTTSALFGVIIGLALQDTLGNFFAGISLHADRPFQVGDVIVVTSNKLTGVVESITWRAIKIRTFQNHIVLVSNSLAAREAIEVSPRDNLNARIVFFGTIYTDSPAKTIHIVREAVRDADNVSDKITPIVRIRGLGDSSVDWEIKYWLDD